jgi:uncharacterized protein YjdB
VIIPAGIDTLYAGRKLRMEVGVSENDASGNNLLTWGTATGESYWETDGFGEVTLMEGQAVPSMATAVIPQIGAISINGNDKLTWDVIAAQKIEKVGRGTFTADNLSATYKAGWNGDKLYVRVEVKDDTKKDVSSPKDCPWSYDDIELYFNPDGISEFESYGADASQLGFVRGSDTTSSLSVIANNCGQKANHPIYGGGYALNYSRAQLWAMGFNFVTKETADGWLIEAQIPEAMIVPAGMDTFNVGRKLRMEVGVSENDASGNNLLTWATATGESYWETDGFGEVELGSTTPAGMDSNYVLPISAISINGDSKLAWDKVIAQKVEKVGRGTFTADNLSATYKAGFNDNNLYVRVEVKDDTKKDVSSPKDCPWSYDDIELYFNPDGISEFESYGTDASQIGFIRGSDTTSSLSVIANNCGQKANHPIYGGGYALNLSRAQLWAKGFNFATKETADGWVLEAKIPASVIIPAGMDSIYAGRRLRMEVGVSENDASGNNLLTWATATGESYWETDGFGELILIEDETQIQVPDLNTPIVDIDIVQPEITLAKNTSPVKLEVVAVPSGAVLPDVTFASLDEAVATVDNQGKVTFVGEGSTFVVASAFINDTISLYDSVTVNSIYIPVDHVDVTGNLDSIGFGNSIQLSATILPATASNTTILWASSDPTVATVDNNGLVTATKKLGSAIIYAIGADGLPGKFTVRTYAPVRKPYLDTPFVIKGDGSVSKLECWKYDEGGQGLAFNENSLNNEAGGPSVRSDNAVEVIPGDWAGSNYLIGYTRAGNPGETTEWLKYTVNVEDTGYYKVGFIVAQASGPEHEGFLWINLVNTDRSLSTSRIDYTATGGWTTFDTIYSEILLFKGENQTLQYFMADGNHTALLFTKTNKPVIWNDVTSVTLDNSVNLVGSQYVVQNDTLDADPACAGNSVNLATVVLPDNATNKNLVYSTSNNKVATVDDFGKVTGVLPGTCYIYGTSNNGIVDSTLVIVSPYLLPTGIGFAKQVVSMAVGDTLVVKGIVKPAGTCEGIDKWTTSSSTAVSVTALPDNEVQLVANAIGSSLIEAAISSFNIKGSFAVNVGTSTIDENLADKISIYPNPVSDELNINSSVDIISFDIISLTGQIVMSENNINDITYHVNTSGLKSGVYMIRVINKNGSSISRVVVE